MKYKAKHQDKQGKSGQEICGLSHGRIKLIVGIAGFLTGFILMTLLLITPVGAKTVTLWDYETSEYKYYSVSGDKLFDAEKGEFTHQIPSDNETDE